MTETQAIDWVEESRRINDLPHVRALADDWHAKHAAAMAAMQDYWNAFEVEAEKVKRGSAE